MENPPSRVPPSHIDPDRVATMYGELGNKLVRNDLSPLLSAFAISPLNHPCYDRTLKRNLQVQHAKRTQALAHLPPYQTEIVRAVTREVRDLDRDVKPRIVAQEVTITSLTFLAYCTYLLVYRSS